MNEQTKTIFTSITPNLFRYQWNKSIKFLIKEEMLPLTLEKLMSFEVKCMLLEEIPVTTR